MSEIGNTVRNLLKLKGNSPASTVSVDDIAKIMGQMGFDIARDKDGGIVPVPRDLTNGDGSLTPNFADTWNRLFDDGSANSENRESRFKSYDRMDASGAESALILDTYADETLNIVDSSRYSIKVEMSDENIKKKVNECFNINGIWERGTGG
jgi:hypothetical protein